MWDIHAKEFFAAIKKSEIVTFAGKKKRGGLQLEVIMLSKNKPVSKRQIPCVFFLM